MHLHDDVGSGGNDVIGIAGRHVGFRSRDIRAEEAEARHPVGPWRKEAEPDSVMGPKSRAGIALRVGGTRSTVFPQRVLRLGVRHIADERMMHNRVLRR